MTTLLVASALSPFLPNTIATQSLQENLQHYSISPYPPANPICRHVDCHKTTTPTHHHNRRLTLPRKSLSRSRTPILSFTHFCLNRSCPISTVKVCNSLVSGSTHNLVRYSHPLSTIKHTASGCGPAMLPRSGRVALSVLQYFSSCRQRFVILRHLPLGHRDVSSLQMRLNVMSRHVLHTWAMLNVAMSRSGRMMTE